MTLIRLAIDARNPGEYLAVCGLVELIGRVDPEAMSGWTRRAGMAPEVPTARSDVCEIDADLDEAQFARELGIALGARNSWSAVTESGRVPLADAVGAWCAGVEVSIPPQNAVVVIDHWYERAFVKGGRILAKDGKNEAKRGWKFWAGQQDKNKGIAGIILDLVDATATMPRPTRMQELLRYRVNGRSPLKLDAATTRSSIDRGVSANDAEKEGAAFVRPSLELLAAVGVSSFFPPRRYGDAAPDRAVGIHGRAFRYYVWKRTVPLAIARLRARGAYANPSQATSFEAPIGGKEYAYLKFARSAGVAEIASPSDDSSEEEDADE